MGVNVYKKGSVARSLPELVPIPKPAMITREHIDEMVRLYNMGYIGVQIGKYFGYTGSRIYYYLNEHKAGRYPEQAKMKGSKTLPPITPRKYTRDEAIANRAQLVNLSDQGYSNRDIAKAVGLCSSTVGRIIYSVRHEGERVQVGRRNLLHEYIGGRLVCIEQYHTARPSRAKTVNANIKIKSVKPKSIKPPEQVAPAKVATIKKKLEPIKKRKDSFEGQKLPPGFKSVKADDLIGNAYRIVKIT